MSLKPKQKGKEITSLNAKLHEDLSITALEERLEMGCYINACPTNGDNSCTGYVDCSCLGYVDVCPVDVCTRDIINCIDAGCRID